MLDDAGKDCQDDRDPCVCGHDLSWHDDGGACCHEDCRCRQFRDMPADYDAA